MLTLAVLQLAVIVMATLMMMLIESADRQREQPAGPDESASPPQQAEARSGGRAMAMSTDVLIQISLDVFRGGG
jgi:hypothetical protein